MNNHWQRKTLSCCVSAALAQLAMGAAQADSAIGVNTMLGNALNPDTINTVRARDPEVVDAVPDERTPTGKLIGWPYAVPTVTTTASGWKYHGEVELGGIFSGGNTNSWWFNQYKDLPDSGPYLNNFYIRADQPDKGKGYFIEALGGGVGYNDQFEGVSFGQYNDWKVKLFYNETPHTFTTTYHNPWSGIGGDNLTLNTLTPGGTLANTRIPTLPNNPSTAQLTAQAAALTTRQAAGTAATKANIQNAINGLDDSTLGLIRHTGGLTIDKWITNAWRFYGSYTNEHRKGARPFGAVFGGGGGGDVEIPESIDYVTQDILGALRYDDGVNNLNLQVNVSLFHNNVDTMAFQNPVYAIVSGVTTSATLPAANAVVPGTRFPAGTFDLYPDNIYTNIRAEYARSMPEWYHSRLTATASFTKMKQDDSLVPWTQYDMNGMFVNGVSAYNKWNTPGSLTKQSANAEIDTQLYDLSFVMKPTAKLDVNAKFRYYSTDNKTEFLACNPLTGQWGRLLNDGSGSGVVGANTAAGNPPGTAVTAYDKTNCNLGATQALNLVPASANNNLRNIPFQYKKINYELGGDYHVATGQIINARLAREDYDRDYRERNKTWENIAKLGYVNRAFQFGTLRASVEYGRRRGDTYVYNPYEEFMTGSLGPLPTANGTNVGGWLQTNAAARKFDLADRNRLNLDFRLDLIAMHDLDVGITGQYRNIDYPNSDYGRTDHQNLGTLSLDVNWQPSPKLGLVAYYTYQAGSLEQNNSMGGGCILGNTYYFFSDGTTGTAAAGAVAPKPVNPGATVVATTVVNTGNWQAVCPNASPTSPLYPSSYAFQTKSQDTNNVLGLGARYDFGFVRADLDGTYIKGVTSTNYTYNQTALSTLAGFNNGAANTIPANFQQTLGMIGGGQPDMDYNQEIINLNLVFPISKAIALRALYRYEQGTVTDWHYAGVATNPVPSVNGGTVAAPTAVANSVYLDYGPQDYHTNTFGLLVQVNF